MLSITLSGSTVFLFYCFIKPLLKKYYPVYFRYYLLKTALLFYILPFSYLFSLFKGFFHKKKPPIVIISLNKTIQITSSKIILFNHFEILNLLKYFLLIWFIAMLIFTANSVFQYFRLKGKLHSNCRDVYKQEQYLFDELKTTYHIRKKVQLKKSSYIESPITIGILQPIIFLPNFLFQEDELRMSLSHELIHIKHNDLLIKLLSLMVLLLHWFNPLSYFLNREVNKISEYSCDETYVQHLSLSERRCYGKLIYKLATFNSQNSSIFFSAFSSKKFVLKERIDQMIKIKSTYKNYIHFSAVLILIGSLTTGTITVQACNLFPLINWTNQDINMKGPTTSIIYSEEYNTDSKFRQYQNSNIKTTQNYLEIDGTYKEIKNNTEKANCKHSFKNTKYLKHILNKNNSCYMDTYDAFVCSKCNYVKVGELEKSIFYAKCPH